MKAAARHARTALAAIGALAIVLLVVGLALDVRAFDSTSGGYEPPYTDFEGTPVDWSRTDLTADGMAKRGYVVNVLIDCTDGMIRFELYSFLIPFRTFSERALEVHEPRAACEARGFAPEF